MKPNHLDLPLVACCGTECKPCFLLVGGWDNDQSKKYILNTFSLYILILGSSNHTDVSSRVFLISLALINYLMVRKQGQTSWLTAENDLLLVEGVLIWSCRKVWMQTSWKKYRRTETILWAVQRLTWSSQEKASNSDIEKLETANISFFCLKDYFTLNKVQLMINKWTDL